MVCATRYPASRQDAYKQDTNQSISIARRGLVHDLKGVGLSVPVCRATSFGVYRYMKNVIKC